MPEYIVDCEHVPYVDGMTLVLPVSINGHVHEPVTRCRDCLYGATTCVKGRFVTVCTKRADLAHVKDLDGFCDEGVRGDG